MIIQSLLVNLTRLPKECGKEAMKTSGHVLVDVVHDTWNMKQKLELKHKLLFVIMILFLMVFQTIKGRKLYLFLIISLPSYPLTLSEYD